MSDNSAVLCIPNAPRLRPRRAPFDPPPFDLNDESADLTSPSHAPRLCSAADHRGLPVLQLPALATVVEPTWEATQEGVMQSVCLPLPVVSSTLHAMLQPQQREATSTPSTLSRVSSNGSVTGLTDGLDGNSCFSCDSEFMIESRGPLC
mmetsp:Transcript_126979/g.253815  ORF Transcript_126979/g.253815 Transcript_126979/m.253815 type:complete len:149 (-) Transcript_126979:115-561(-)